MHVKQCIYTVYKSLTTLIAVNYTSRPQYAPLCTYKQQWKKQPVKSLTLRAGIRGLAVPW